MDIYNVYVFKFYCKKMGRDWVIYKITNPAGHAYIGRTCCFERRMVQYKYINCKKQVKIYRSLLKYGYSAHTVEIIDSFQSDYGYMKGKEIFWIKSYMTNGNKYMNGGLNCSDGGGGILGKKHSNETKNKIRETKLKNPTVCTTEMREAISKRMKGNRYNVGKKRPEWVERMRVLNTGKKYPGRKRTPEQIEKTASKNRGRKMPEKVKKIFLKRIEGMSKGVCQYDIYGKSISEYKSISEAGRISGCLSSSIGLCARGIISQTNGFVFKYKDGSSPEFKGHIKLTKEEKKERDLARKKVWYQKNKKIAIERVVAYKNRKNQLKEDKYLD